MKLTPQQIKKFQTLIFVWWKKNKRDLPWRHTRDPYKILVSEVMLQQTQVSRVLPKYKEFLKKFPTLKKLNISTTADVLRAWKGMGYNRRALYLTKINSIPSSEKKLIKLPGIGKYTARAIMVFAYKKNIALVDTNIRQIITHFFFKDKPQKEKIIQEVADQLVPKGKSWDWHQALMDYGAIALPKIPGIVKKQKIFKDSDRFYRGKIIDLLRENAMKEKRLFMLIRKYKKTDIFISKILTSLEKDALIVRYKGMFSLPD